MNCKVTIVEFNSNLWMRITQIDHVLYVVSRAPDRTKITVWSNSYTKVVSSVQEFAGQNNEISVGMVNRTVEYECALNVCVVNVGSSSAQ